VNWRNLIHLVRQNLLRMKIRVAMTAIGVLIGTAAVILLVSLGIGLQRFAVQDIGSIGELTEINVYSPAGLGGVASTGTASDQPAVLNDRALNSFRDLPGVVAVTPLEPVRAGVVIRAASIHDSCSGWILSSRTDSPAWGNGRRLWEASWPKIFRIQ
jgi:hypothetical protein